VEVKMENHFKNLNLSNNNILKELKGSFFMSIGMAFQSAK